MIYLGVALKTDEVITVVAKPIVLKTKTKLDISFRIDKITEITEEKQATQYLEILKNIIVENGVNVVVSKWVDFAHTKKFKGIDKARLKERLLIACGLTDTMFVETDTYGWEGYLTEKTNTHDKTKLIKEAFGINLKDKKKYNYNYKQYQNLANTIIMTIGVASGKIKARPRQIITYDYKLKKGGK